MDSHKTSWIDEQLLDIIDASPETTHEFRLWLARKEGNGEG